MGKDVIINVVDVIGIRDNKYTTALGIIKSYIYKMQVRGKESTMISKNDEDLLLNPNENKKKEKAVVSKIIKNFIKNKEEKDE